MRYNITNQFFKRRGGFFRAAVFGMTGAILASQPVAAAAESVLPAPSSENPDISSLKTFQGTVNIQLLTEADSEPGEPDNSRKGSGSGRWDEQDILERWEIDSASLPSEPAEEAPAVPEELKPYFEEAVSDTVNMYHGTVPPAPDLSKYSLRADTIRAAVRDKARIRMEEESGKILDKMKSYTASFSVMTFPSLASELQRQTPGKLAAFGKEKESGDGTLADSHTSTAGSSGDFSSSQTDQTSSAGKGPFLSALPGSQTDVSDRQTDLSDREENNAVIPEEYAEDTGESVSEDFAGTDAGNDSPSSDPAAEGFSSFDPAAEGYSSSDPAAGGFSYSDPDAEGSPSFDPAEEGSSVPDSVGITDNFLFHSPPGMSSFLSYIPGMYPDNPPVSGPGADDGGISDAFADSNPAQVQGTGNDEEAESGRDILLNPDQAAPLDELDILLDTDQAAPLYEQAVETDPVQGETANFALARPFDQGSLYYKYKMKEAGHSGEDSAGTESGHDREEEEFLPGRRVVFIGDSRTVGMEMFVGGREDEYWSAKNSMGYSWLVSSGAPAVENLIDENTDVVILMGVNDLGNVSRYVDYMNAKAADWKERGARTFFVSVTPVVDSKSPNAKNSRIEDFNAYAVENLKGVHYIDAYNRVRNSFGSPDGIHFDGATYREIYRIIHFYLYRGWYEEAGLRFYFDCGRPLTGWQYLDGHWQYMDGAGVRWIRDSRVGDVCLAPYPMTGLTDPNISVLSKTF